MPEEKKKLLYAAIYPVLMVVVMWLVKVVEVAGNYEFYQFGIYPLHAEGLKGIVFSPFIHGSFQHLISNTFPVLILGTSLFYFYRNLAIPVTVLAWLMSGLWVWVFARTSWHIGASGIIYSWAAFLFFSGVIRDHPRLMALALLVAFLYGSIVWGIFPMEQGVSWEGHLMGLLAGSVLALFYKEKGPERKKYSWELEDEEEEIIDPDNPPYWMQYDITGEDKKTDSFEKVTKQNTKDSKQITIPKIRYYYRPYKTKNNKGGEENG